MAAWRNSPILHSLFSIPPGLPERAFSTSAGQITKREVRLLSLAELALGPGEVLWDIGAGSGSVAIEAARAQPTARVLAVERRAAMAERICARTCGASPRPTWRWSRAMHRMHATAGPTRTLFLWAAVVAFLAEIVALARQRLRPGGRLVANLATLEHLHELRTLLPDARVTQAQISRGVPIQGMLRLEALNPVFIVKLAQAS